MLAKWPPLKLAQLAFAGTLIAATTCLSGPVADGVEKLRGRHFLRHHPGPFFLTVDLLTLLAPLLIGALMALPARKQLLEGLEKQQWPEPEVEKTRLWIESANLKKLVTGLGGLAIISFVIFCVWGFHSHPTIRLVSNSLVFLTFPSLFLLNLRQALRPDKPYDPSKSWARTMKPLRSEQWGEREIHDTGRAEA
jgi:hypothetical protein